MLMGGIVQLVYETIDSQRFMGDLQNFVIWGKPGENIKRISFHPMDIVFYDDHRMIVLPLYQGQDGQRLPSPYISDYFGELAYVLSEKSEGRLGVDEIIEAALLAGRMKTMKNHEIFPRPRNEIVEAALLGGRMKTLMNQVRSPLEQL